jgi:hypothetical protein
MTYKELLKELKNATPEQLEQNVTVYLAYEEEYHHIKAVCIAKKNEYDKTDTYNLILSTESYD